MAAQTPRQQRATILREQERDRAAQKRQRLAELRSDLKAAQRRRGEFITEVRALCELARRRLQRTGAARRAQLERELEVEQEAADEQCRLATARARRRGTEALDVARRTVHEERAGQRAEAIYTRPRPFGEPTGAARGRGRRQAALARAEQQDEADEVVERNIEHELVPIWHRVKHKIVETGRKSRTEAFLEWVAEHESEVYAMLESESDRYERQLAQQEEQAAWELGQRSASGEDVPF